MPADYNIRCKICGIGKPKKEFQLRGYHIRYICQDCKNAYEQKNN